MPIPPCDQPNPPSWKGLSFTHKLWGHDVCPGLKPQGYSTAPAEAGLRDNALAPFMGRYLLALAIDGGASVKQPVSPEGDVGKAKPGRVGSDESIAPSEECDEDPDSHKEGHLSQDR